MYLFNLRLKREPENVLSRKQIRKWGKLHIPLSDPIHWNSRTGVREKSLSFPLSWIFILSHCCQERPGYHTSFFQVFKTVCFLHLGAQFSMTKKLKTANQRPRTRATNGRKNYRLCCVISICTIRGQFGGVGRTETYSQNIAQKGQKINCSFLKSSLAI